MRSNPPERSCARARSPIEYGEVARTRGGDAVFTVGWYGLGLLLAAALFCAMAVAALAAARRRSAASRAFLMLNVAAMLWATGTFLRSALPEACAAEPPLSIGWWAWMLAAMGYTTVPVAWFLLAAAQTRRYELLGGKSRLPLAGYIVATYIAVATNHWHGLMELPGSSASLSRPGPLLLLVVPIALSLLATSFWKTTVAHLRGDPRPERRVGVALALTGVLPFIGAITWALGPRSGLVLPADPTPMLAIPVTAVMAYAVARLGSADLAPMAASQAFSAMSDAAIVVDPRLQVLHVNEAAERELPGAAAARTLPELLPEVVPHVVACLADEEGYVPFELRHHGGIYWGRAYRMGRKAPPIGCVVLLSDITDLRCAQEQLELLLLKEGPEPLLVSRRAGGA